MFTRTCFVFVSVIDRNWQYWFMRQLGDVEMRRKENTLNHTANTKLGPIFH